MGTCRQSMRKRVLAVLIALTLSIPIFMDYGRNMFAAYEAKGTIAEQLLNSENLPYTGVEAVIVGPTSGTIVATATSDANGWVIISDVAPGNYRMRVDASAVPNGLNGAEWTLVTFSNEPTLPDAPRIEEGAVDNEAATDSDNNENSETETAEEPVAEADTASENAELSLLDRVLGVSVVYASEVDNVADSLSSPYYEKTVTASQLTTDDLTLAEGINISLGFNKQPEGTDVFDAGEFASYYSGYTTPDTAWLNLDYSITPGVNSFDIGSIRIRVPKLFTSAANVTLPNNISATHFKRDNTVPSTADYFELINDKLIEGGASGRIQISFTTAQVWYIPCDADGVLTQKFTAQLFVNGQSAYETGPLTFILHKKKSIAGPAGQKSPIYYHGYGTTKITLPDAWVPSGVRASANGNDASERAYKDQYYWHGLSLGAELRGYSQRLNKIQFTVQLPAKGTVIGIASPNYRNSSTVDSWGYSEGNMWMYYDAGVDALTPTNIVLPNYVEDLEYDEVARTVTFCITDKALYKDDGYPSVVLYVIMRYDRAEHDAWPAAQQKENTKASVSIQVRYEGEDESVWTSMGSQTVDSFYGYYDTGNFVHPPIRYDMRAIGDSDNYGYGFYASDLQEQDIQFSMPPYIQKSPGYDLAEKQTIVLGMDGLDETLKTMQGTGPNAYQIRQLDEESFRYDSIGPYIDIMESAYSLSYLLNGNCRYSLYVRKAGESSYTLFQNGWTNDWGSKISFRQEDHVVGYYLVIEDVQGQTGGNYFTAVFSPAVTLLQTNAYMADMNKEVTSILAHPYYDVYEDVPAIGPDGRIMPGSSKITPAQKDARYNTEFFRYSDSYNLGLNNLRNLNNPNVLLKDGTILPLKDRDTATMGCPMLTDYFGRPVLYRDINSVVDEYIQYGGAGAHGTGDFFNDNSTSYSKYYYSLKDGIFVGTWSSRFYDITFERVGTKDTYYQNMKNFSFVDILPKGVRLQNGVDSVRIRQQNSNYIQHDKEIELKQLPDERQKVIVRFKYDKNNYNNAQRTKQIDYTVYLDTILTDYNMNDGEVEFKNYTCVVANDFPKTASSPKLLPPDGRSYMVGADDGSKFPAADQAYFKDIDENGKEDEWIARANGGSDRTHSSIAYGRNLLNAAASGVEISVKPASVYPWQKGDKLVSEFNDTLTIRADAAAVAQAQRNLVLYHFIPSKDYALDGNPAKRNNWAPIPQFNGFVSHNLTGIANTTADKTRFNSPTIYYSTTADHRRGEGSFALSQPEVWSTQKPAVESAITAVALDYGDAILEKGDYFSVYFNYLTPDVDVALARAADKNDRKFITRAYAETEYDFSLQTDRRDWRKTFLTTDDIVVAMNNKLTMTISGVVFEDANNDGMMDNGEIGTASQTVRLYSGSNTGYNYVAQTTTNAGGAYSFKVTNEEDYRVFIDPSTVKLYSSQWEISDIKRNNESPAEKWNSAGKNGYTDLFTYNYQTSNYNWNKSNMDLGLVQTPGKPTPPPLANPLSLTAGKWRSVSGQLTGGADSSLPDQTLIYQIITQPAGGRLILNSATSEFIFTPDKTSDTIEFTFTVTDSISGVSYPEKVRITYKNYIMQFVDEEDGSKIGEPADREDEDGDGVIPWGEIESAVPEGYEGNGNDVTLTNPDNPDEVTKVPIKKKSFKVMFDTDGGTPAPGNQTVAFGKLVTAPGNPGKTGYFFTGWYAPGIDTSWDFVNDTMPAHDLILKAGWAEQKYTITFDAGSGHFGSDATAKIVDFTVFDGGPASLPANLMIPAHYIFSGWTPDGSYTIDDLANVTRNMRFTAAYTPVGGVETFTVTFDAGSGHFGNDATAKIVDFTVTGGPVSQPANLMIPAHYIFSGWTPDGSYTIDDLANVTRNMRFTAVYIPVGGVETFAVVFDAGSGHFGSDTTAKTVDFTVTGGGSVSRPNNLTTPLNHNFGGWTPSGAYTIDDLANVTQNMRFTAAYSTTPPTPTPTDETTPPPSATVTPTPPTAVTPTPPATDTPTPSELVGMTETPSEPLNPAAPGIIDSTAAPGTITIMPDEPPRAYQFVYDPELDMYIVMDESGIPLGYVSTPEDFTSIDDIIPFGKINPKTGDNEPIAAIATSVLLIGSLLVILTKDRKNKLNK